MSDPRSVNDIIKILPQEKEELLKRLSEIAKQRNYEIQDVVNERAKEEKQELEAKKKDLWIKICPEEYREFDVSKVYIGVNRDEIKSVMTWKPDKKMGLYIVGDSGRSKTRALYSLIKKAIWYDYKFKVFDAYSFADECTNAVMQGENSERLKIWLSKFRRLDVLFLDDVGKRFNKATQEGFYAVIETMTSWSRPIVMTTQYTGEEIEKMCIDSKTGVAIRRRLKEFFKAVIF